MMAPFIVGREPSVRALEIALGGPARRIFLVAQRDPKIDDPVRDDLYDIGVVARVVQNLKLPNGNIKVMVEGVKRARLVALEEREGTLWADLESYEVAVPGGREAAAVHEQGARHLRAVRQALPAPRLRGADVDPQAGRARPPRRHPGGASDRRHSREAGPARAALALRAPAAAGRSARGRDREDQSRQAHQRAGQEADGEGPEGVLPQREDQGDPSGAGAQGRPHRRDGRAQGADREGLDAQRGAREGRTGAQAARGDAAGLGRGHGLAQLHRVAGLGAVEEGLQGAARPRQGGGDPQLRALRPREDQGADPRVPGGAAADQGDADADPLLRRAAGRRQVVAGEVDRPGDRQEVRPPLARRRA